jgi:hypothetical protein
VDLLASVYAVRGFFIPIFSTPKLGGNGRNHGEEELFKAI